MDSEEGREPGECVFRAVKCRKCLRKGVSKVRLFNVPNEGQHRSLRRMGSGESPGRETEDSKCKQGFQVLLL